MIRKLGLLAFVAMMMLSAMPMASAAQEEESQTRVPGHRDKDSGVVMGKYTAVYAYDAAGNVYYDLGDGRTGHSDGVTSIDDLDAATLTICDYVIQYQGDFGGDPFLNTGWVKNNIRCHGYDGNATYNAIYVHETDPRYTGNKEAIWGTWEIHVDTASGQGNLARPVQHVGS